MKTITLKNLLFWGVVGSFICAYIFSLVMQCIKLGHPGPTLLAGASSLSFCLNIFIKGLWEACTENITEDSILSKIGGILLIFPILFVIGIELCGLYLMLELAGWVPEIIPIPTNLT